MSKIIECAGRQFVALRRASGGSLPVGNRAYHAVTPFCIALCSVEPISRSRWAEPPAEHVTCPDCLRRLTKLRELGNSTEPSTTVNEGAYHLGDRSRVVHGLGGD
jgi:hypothetical protein